MNAILLTGMSATGKSTLLGALRTCGHPTVDTDHGPWLHLVDGEPRWRAPLMDALLARDHPRTLFVAGCVAGQSRFYDRFAAVVLLTAPREVLLARLATRTTNDFGKLPAERARVERDLAETEPLLRAGATHVLDTTAPLRTTLAALLALTTPPT